MRILQILPHLSKGGAEKVVVDLSNSLLLNKHSIDILCSYKVDPALNEVNLDPRIIIEYTSPHTQSNVIRIIEGAIWLIRNRRKLGEYDVIHCHLTFGLIAGAILRLLRKFRLINNFRLIYTCHIVGTGTSKSRRFLNRVLSIAFDKFVIMALDEYWGQRISKDKNLCIIRNGIAPFAKSSAKRYEIPRKIWRIGTISRLHSERFPERFLNLFAELRSVSNDKFEFIIGGDGPELENLVMTSKALGIDDVTSFPGLIQDPRKFLSNLDLYIALNVGNTTGVAGLEAVFSGVPVLGIQLSKEYEVSAEDWIWSGKNIPEVARRIVRYLDTPVMLGELAGRQFKIAQREFTVERMTREYLSLYSF
jgi:glycosyltransferase involved in cell wall biosynthesis